MKHRTFFWFFLPTALVMLLFIALPLVSIVTQSLYTDHEQVFKTVKNCGPFGCKEETIIDQEASAALKEDNPLGRFAGLQVYKDRGHLAVNEVSEAWRTTDSFSAFFRQIQNFPFYRALSFTLTYTFIVTPLLIVLGFAIAVGVNSLHRHLKGLVIFFSLLPMIVTPLIGSLILFWMIDSRGAFVVFYAGLQTLPKDTLESAQIDGATRWQQIRYVVIPHIMPLVTFVALIQLMDNFRVFEPIFGWTSDILIHIHCHLASSRSLPVFVDPLGLFQSRTRFLFKSRLDQCSNWRANRRRNGQPLHFYRI